MQKHTPHTNLLGPRQSRRDHPTPCPRPYQWRGYDLRFGGFGKAETTKPQHRSPRSRERERGAGG